MASSLVGRRVQTLRCMGLFLDWMCWQNEIPFIFLFSCHEGPSTPQALSLSVTTPVTLYYLTLTLSVEPHTYTPRKSRNKELRARNTHHPKNRYHNQQYPAYIATTHYHNIPTTKNKQLLKVELHHRSPHEVFRLCPSWKPARCRCGPR